MLNCKMIKTKFVFISLSNISPILPELFFKKGMPKAGETTRTGGQGTVGLPLLMVVPKPS